MRSKEAIDELREAVDMLKEAVSQLNKKIFEIEKDMAGLMAEKTRDGGTADAVAPARKGRLGLKK